MYGGVVQRIQGCRWRHSEDQIRQVHSNENFLYTPLSTSLSSSCLSTRLLSPSCDTSDWYFPSCAVEGDPMTSPGPLASPGAETGG